MKTVNVYKAAGVEVESGTLLAGVQFEYNNTMPLTEVAAIMESDADKVVEFLTSTLPQGTVDRVIGKLLVAKASHFIVPFFRGAEMADLRSERQLASIVIESFSKLSSVCKHRCSHNGDCEHPDIEFSCMGCHISQCPLLIGGDND